MSLGNVESNLPDMLQPLPFEQVKAGGSRASWHHPISQTRDWDELSVEAVRFTHPLRSCQCREELPSFAMAAKWPCAVLETPWRSILSSQRLGSNPVLVRSTLGLFSQYPNIPIRLQDETARLEDELMKPEALEALLKCFVTAKANSFENLLDPFLKICRISTRITIGTAKSQFFKRVIDRLAHSKAVVRLNLLRILRTVCDVHPNRAILVERYGLHEIVAKLSKDDGAVLVRELAREILPALAPALKPSNRSVLKGTDTPKSGSIAPKKPRRTASETSAIGVASLLAPTPRLQGRDTTGEAKPSRTKLGDIAWQSGKGRWFDLVASVFLIVVFSSRTFICDICIIPALICIFSLFITSISSIRHVCCNLYNIHGWPRNYIFPPMLIKWPLHILY